MRSCTDLPPPKPHNHTQREAVLHAQTGALQQDVLLERASRIRRILPDTPPAPRLLRALSAEEASRRILEAVKVFRCARARRLLPTCTRLCCRWEILTEAG